MKSVFHWLILLIFFSCNSPGNNHNIRNSIEFGGEAQGSTYMIKYNGDNLESYHEEIDSILQAFDHSLSLWKEGSTINRFNQDTVLEIEDPYFMRMLELSKDVYDTTSGAFNPLVAQLIQVWGFGPDGVPTADSTTVDSLLDYISWEFSWTKLANGRMKISNPKKLKLNFNAIAQGYSVDVIAEFLQGKGINNYLIEIGGELIANGTNNKGELWKIGIDKPIEESTGRPLQAIITLNNKAVATSGSYRKFYQRDGIKYSHTIDPGTGYPVSHNLLSATVIADQCALADAFATAFMVMGKERTIQFLEENPQLALDVFLVFSDNQGKYQTYISPGLQDIVEET